MSAAHTDHPFSLTRGGPLYRIRWVWLAVFAWLPLIPAAVVQLVAEGRVDAILVDPTIHVRLLAGVPLLVLAERMLETRCEHAVVHVREEAVVDNARLQAIVDRAERLRNARLVEVALAVAVLLLGQAALWGVGGWGELVFGRADGARISFATVWCLAIALPIVQFLQLRWLWRWVVWIYVLARLARRPLSLDALHPDRAAGLSPLAGPIDAFAMFVAALSAIASASWTAQIVDHRATLASLAPQLAVAFGAAVVVACAPLLVFSRQIYRARHRDAAAYHTLAREYVDEFRRKWLVGRPDEPVLGVLDLQSLNDLGGSYRTAQRTRLVPVGARELANLAAGALVPLVPLLLVVAPLSRAAGYFARILFGLAP